MFARFVVDDRKLRTTIVARVEGLRDFTQPLEAIGALSRDAAIVRIRDEGANVDPPWIPSRKTQAVTIPTRYGNSYTITGSGGRTGVDEGAMMRSITWNLEGSNAVKTGTNIPYARLFQFGSGEYGVGPNEGHTSWTIRPVGKQALSWVFGGRRFFARSVVQHGQPPRPFLFFDEPLIEAIIDEFRRYVSAKR